MVKRPDLPAQTGLRGIAALTVFIAHGEFYRLFPEYPAVQRFYNVFYWHGVAVELFFVLSGFILCYVYLHRDFTWRQYALGRFARIYPVYFVALLFFIGLNCLAFLKTGVFSAATTPGTVITNFLLVQDWLFFPHFISLIPPSWSISVEIFLYIFLFPILCYSQKSLGPIGRILLTTLPVAMLAVIQIFNYAMPLSISACLTGILCFTSGFFICTMGLETNFPPLPRWLEVLVGLIVFASLFFEFPLSRGYTCLGFPFLVYITATTSLTTRLLSVPLLVWLGDLSYSVYIWHWCTIKAGSVLFGIREVGGMHPGHPRSFLGHCVYVALLIGGTLLLSHFSHYYFEMPLAKRLRGRKKASVGAKKGLPASARP